MPTHEKDGRAEVWPQTCVNCPVGPNTLYAPTFLTDPGAISKIRREVRIIPKRRRLFKEGEKRTEVFTLRSGWAFRYRELSNARRQILAFFIPGDTISLEALAFPNQSMPFSAKSLTQITVCVFQIDDLIRLVSSSDAQKAELEDASRQFAGSMVGRFTDIGRRSAEGRIVHLILDFQARLQRRSMTETDGFYFPLRQEHIADMLGLTPVHVSRVLGSLRRTGIVEVNNYRLSILNQKSLERIGEEE